MNLIRRPIALAAVLLCGFAAMLGAQPAATNTVKRPQPGRWLLILDTSAKMERRAKGVEGMVNDLLSSGMNGQMAPGSEIGIWTYNKSLYAGVAPLQTWDPARSNVIAGRTVAFLEKQDYRDKANLEPVLRELPDVVRSSRELTIIWFSDGSQNLTNTIYDDAINAAFAKYRPELSKNRMPLVTVLRVYQGKFVGQNVSVAPWPIEFPPFPEAKTNKPATPTLAAPKPEPVKPIFISAPKKPAVESPPSVPVAGGTVQLRPPPEEALTNPPAPNSLPTVIEPKPVAPVEAAQAPTPIQPAPAAKPVEPAPAPKPIEVAAVPPTPAPSPVAPREPEATLAKPLSPIPVATPPSETVTARKWPLILGISFMWVAIIVALVLARRARRANATSLITRSFEQDRK